MTVADLITGNKKALSDMFGGGFVCYRKSTTFVTKCPVYTQFAIITIIIFERYVNSR